MVGSVDSTIWYSRKPWIFDICDRLRW